MDVYEIIKELCKKEGITIPTLEKELGLSRNAIYRWKTQSPSIDRLLTVANFFNVSLDFLVGRKAQHEFDDINYKDILEQEAEAKLGELLEILQDYFYVNFDETNKYETRIAINEYEGNKDLGVSISENELKSEASYVLKRIDNIEYNFDSIFIKSILASLFNNYTPEENFINELLSDEFDRIKVLSTLIPNTSKSDPSKTFMLNEFVLGILVQPFQQNDDAYVTLPVILTIAVDGKIDQYFCNLDVIIDKGAEFVLTITFNYNETPPHILYSEHKGNQEHAKFFWENLSNVVLEYARQELGNRKSNKVLFQKKGAPE